MFDSQLRDVKEFVFVRLVKAFRLRQIPPLWFTAVSLICGLLAGWALWQQQTGLGFLLWVLNRVFDGLDGTIARDNDVQTDFGGYADILADFVSYAVIPVGLAAGRPSLAGWQALAFLLTTFYVNAASWMYLAAILEKRQVVGRDKTTIVMPKGIIGGGETILFYSVFILFSGWFIPLFWLMGALVLVTVLQRLVWAYHKLD
jgi:phosphatidylglycerophosphate synthase